jgi:hypothetical protein
MTSQVIDHEYTVDDGRQFAKSWALINNYAITGAQFIEVTKFGVDVTISYIWGEGRPGQHSTARMSFVFDTIDKHYDRYRAVQV